MQMSLHQSNGNFTGSFPDLRYRKNIPTVAIDAVKDPLVSFCDRISTHKVIPTDIDKVRVLGEHFCEGHAVCSIPRRS